ncbi:hypothetical protein GGR57DRAFT_165716 [Xylariaceae sp. FL1272]|nr:hypothetical protein GGR57DRAFT_165716 [Xylariaceae sp. FL1272]
MNKNDTTCTIYYPISNTLCLIMMAHALEQDRNRQRVHPALLFVLCITLLFRVKSFCISYVMGEPPSFWATRPAYARLFTELDNAVNHIILQVFHDAINLSIGDCKQITKIGPRCPRPIVRCIMVYYCSSP